MNQPKSNLKWLLIVLIIVIIGGGLYYYFGIFKGGKTTVIASPTPTAAISPTASSSTKTSTPTSGQTTTPSENQTSINPNLTSFAYNTMDSLWPNDITVKFDALGKTFDKSIYSLKDGDNRLITFGTDYGYYPSTDALATARTDAAGHQRLTMPDSFTYDNPVATTVSGLSAASYKWTKESSHYGTTKGITVIVLVYPGVGQKAFEINGYLDQISESDFNKVLQSIIIST